MLFIRLILLLFITAMPCFANTPLEQKIGQMIMVGFRGYQLDNDLWISQQIEKGQVGGVILYNYDSPTKKFERNIQSKEQLKNLTRQLQNRFKATLLIAIDQEGGVINNLPENYGFPPFESQQSLGEKNDPARTAKQGHLIATTLGGLGINVNFAPVVDLATNRQGAIAKKQRSFSADPVIVTTHAREFVRAHKKEHVLTSLKHFPGLGSGGEDTHDGFVDITKVWEEAELEPYKSLIDSGDADLVMVGHGYNGKLDKLYPFSLSKNVIQDLLRNKLHFQGVVITDDLQMKAISKYYSLEDAVRLTLEAGTDILLFSNQQTYDPEIAPKVIAIIKKLIQEGVITENRIDQSVERIQKLKQGVSTHAFASLSLPT